MTGTPPAEHDVAVGLVKALLAEQHPDLAGLPLTAAVSGWDNVTYRLGADLAVRLPRRAAAGDLIAREQRWLAELARHLPLPIPVPLRTGLPGCGYPWVWSVVPWLDGEPADSAPPDPAEAPVLGSFLRALHRPAPQGAPQNRHRGVALRSCGESLVLNLRAVSSVASIDVDALKEVFTAGVTAPLAHRRTWLHGDFHPRNVLTSNGRLTAVLDWGDLTGGDPATDIAGLWMLFRSESHSDFWDAYGPAEPGLEERARGWAVTFGTTLLRVGLADRDRLFTAVGHRTLASITGGQV